MQIAEARLRQIVLQEVHARLLGHYIDQEIERLISEDEDWKAAKWKARKKKIRDASLGALGLGTVAGALGGEVSDYEDTRAAKNDARVAQNIAAANTDEARLEDFATQLNNRYRFLWGKGDDMAVYYPGTKGKVTVLPPSYSLAVQAFLDKKANIERIERGEEPIMRYGNIDLENLSSLSQVEYQGTPDGNIDKVFDVYSGSDMIDAMAVLRAVPELEVVPGSGTEKAIVMLKPGNIEPGYMLPELGMTAEDYYKSQYGEFMGSGEKTALDLPDEEITITVGDDDEIDPELIQKTKDHADSLRESKITWKNYKNRKKKLA